jgi:hypothetical protein
MNSFGVYVLIFVGQQIMTFESQNFSRPEAPRSQEPSGFHAQLNQSAGSESLGFRSSTLAPEPKFLVMTDPFKTTENQEGQRLADWTGVDDGSPKYPQLADLKERIDGARYPRIGEAWTPADQHGDKSGCNLSEDDKTTLARHDLYFSSAESFGLKWKKDSNGGQTADLEPSSIEKAKQLRADLLKKNPNMVMLSEIRYHDADAKLFPKNSPFWQHDSDGNPIANPDYKQFNELDYKNPAFQQHVADQARAAVASGAVDGVMLDWFQDGNNNSDKQAKQQLLEKVRAAVGPDALIMINSNESKMPLEATKLVNGYYMESSKTKDMNGGNSAAEWKQIQDTLAYSEQNGKPPHINMVETWWDKSSGAQRGELDKMRATTTLVMTQSDGYALFADPDNNGKTKDHSHDWYSFWNTDVGKPLGAGTVRPDGSVSREFEKATVLSNATGDNPVTVKFNSPMRRASDQTIIAAGEIITVAAHDGEIFEKQ